MSDMVLDTTNISIDESYNDLSITGSDVELEISNSAEINTIEPEYEARIQKKSFTIVDDNLFIAEYSNLDEAPSWLKNLISISVSNKIDGSNQDLLDNIATMINNLSNMYVPENQYTQTITNLSNQNSNALVLINSLDSTFRGELGIANSKIINLESTKASLSEVDTRVATVLNAELVKDGSNIKTTIGNLNQAISTEKYSRGVQYNGLVSSIGNVQDGLSATATATTNLYTYVGVNEDGTETGNGLLANSSAITNLQNGLQTTNGTVSAHTSELSTVNTRITNGLISAESKWAYNSNLTLNGVSYSSGFGLATSLTSGSIPAGQSEFWINADKLKMTTTGYNGTKYSPFIVNGSNGEITFNGKVAFSNITGYTPPDVAGSISTNNNTFAQAQGFASYADMASKYGTLGKTIISAGYINTGLVRADSILANSVSADRLVAGTNSSTVWTGGGLVSSNFNGNVAGDIGSPSSGFRLSSNAAGTSIDPNIYGAYIKGSIIDVEDMKVRAEGYPSNFGRVSYSLKNGSVKMPGYGSGYMVDRICSQSKSIIKVDCWARGYDDRVLIALQYTTDGTNYYTIRTHSSLVAGMTNTSHVTLAFAEVIDPYLVSATGWISFRLIDAGSEQPATNVYSDITITIFNS